MRIRSLVLVCAALALLVVALPAVAQEQSASIEGVIKDAQGGVLPGATVEARNVQGAVVSAVTDGQGRYRFPSLLPGKYEVSATLAGFKTGKVANLELLLGQIKSVNFLMEIAGVAENVTVNADAPLVDTRQSARATSIAREQINMLPTGRDFTSLVTQAPGANGEGKSNGLMIDGATTSENRYIVDGAETSDIVSGGTGKQVLPDFIEEVQVKSSGYTAEYGGAMGGVINVITKSGSNTWRGNALLYHENTRLGSSAPAPYQAGRPTLRLNLDDQNLAEYITYPKDTYSRSEPGFSLGGPIQKNRAWFFAAYQPTLERIERTVTYVGDNRTQESAAHTMPSQYLSANQTMQLGSNLRTRVAYNNSWSKTISVNGATIFALPSADGSDMPGLDYNFGTTIPNQSLSGQLDWVVRPTMFISGRVGYFQSNARTYGLPDAPQFIWRTSTVGMAGVPASLQKTTNAVNILANDAVDFDKQERLSAQFDVSWFGTAKGQHTFKGGIQLDRLANNVSAYETAPYSQLYYATDGSQRYRGQTGAYGFYRFRVAVPGARRGVSTDGDVATNNVGLFVQDAWTVSNRLTINMGLRTENENVAPFKPGLDLLTGLPAEGTAGMSAIKFGFKDKLAPRLGFAWDLKGDGKWKSYASWGIFYDIFKMNLSRGSFGGEKWLEYWYTLETPDWTTLLDPVGQGGCPPACPASMGRKIRGPLDYRSPGSVDPAVKPMRSQEFSAGLEHQLSKVSAVSARYVHKQLDRAVDDTGSYTETAEVYVIANPGFGMTQWACNPTSGCSQNIPLPKARRQYDAVELAFTKNFSNRYYARVSYLWSRLYGNYSGLDQTDENGRTSPNTGRLYDAPLQSFDGHGDDVEGLLATDRPHQVKAQVIYQLPFGTTLGANVYVSSGFPKTREVAVINGSGYPMFYMGRGSDGRMPTYSQTDLVVQHEFKLGGGRSFQASVNVLNLFNQAIPTNYFQTENAYGKYLDFDTAAFYAHQVDVGALKATTPGWAADPRFMKEGYSVSPVSGYQLPRQVRFGLKFLF